MQHLPNKSSQMLLIQDHTTLSIDLMMGWQISPNERQPRIPSMKDVRVRLSWSSDKPLALTAARCQPWAGVLCQGGTGPLLVAVSARCLLHALFQSRIAARLSLPPPHPHIHTVVELRQGSQNSWVSNLKIYTFLAWVLPLRLQLRQRGVCLHYRATKY